MAGYVNIIKSNIIPSRYDEFWKDQLSVFSGVFPKDILVIVNACEDGSEEELQLIKMLTGSKLKPGQYNIIKLDDGQMVAWHQFLQKLVPKIVFIIGVSPAQLGISALFKINEPNHFNDTIWLPTVSLKELELHAHLKKQLWQDGMKPIFVDKKFGEF